MSTWLKLAHDNRKAVQQLLPQQSYRSSVSRSYYAVFALIAHELDKKKIPMPMGREGPSHGKVAAMIVDNLGHLKPQVREAVALMVRELYSARIAADYKPSMDIAQKEAKVAASLMNKVFNAL